MSKQLIPGPVEGPLADNERLKRESNFLRGTIAEDLQDPSPVASTATTSS